MFNDNDCLRIWIPYLRFDLNFLFFNNLPSPLNYESYTVLNKQLFPCPNAVRFFFYATNKRTVILAGEEDIFTDLLNMFKKNCCRTAKKPANKDKTRRETETMPPAIWRNVRIYWKWKRFLHRQSGAVLEYRKPIFYNKIKQIYLWKLQEVCTLCHTNIDNPWNVHYISFIIMHSYVCKNSKLKCLIHKLC